MVKGSGRLGWNGARWQTIREPQDLPFGIKWGGRAWSKMVKKVRFESPSTHANILASNLWWNSIVHATKEGFHEKRGLLNHLQRAGL